MKGTFWFQLLLHSAAIVDAAIVHASEDTRHLRVAVPAQKEHAVALVEKERQPDLPKMPEAHNPFVPLGAEKEKKRVMNAINKMRAEVCYRMKVESGVEFGSFDNCEKFMEKACRPGRDDKMDGDHKEITSGEGYCQEFFPEAEKKAKKQIEDEDKAEAEAAASPGPSAPIGIFAPAPAGAPSPAADDEGAQVSPAPAGSAGSTASMDAPDTGKPMKPLFIPGKSGGKPEGKLKKNEAWYFNKGGKDTLRVHMDENLKLPTQGYWGKLVSHDDMETATEDWGKEFGTNSGHGTYESHCKKYCDTEWCIRWGYCGSHQHKNSGVAASAHVFISMLLATTITYFF